MLKIAICDDDQGFRKSVQGFLYQYQKKNNISFQMLEAQTGMHLLNMLNDSVDVLFLDIKMKNLNGIETAKRLRNKNEHIQIIFMTSAPEYALEGYKVNAFDYLVKPIRFEQFCSMMDKLLKRMEKVSDYILVRNYDNVHKILINSIFFMETYERNLLIHTKHGNFISHKKLKVMEKSLSEKGFYRCNSGYLVNFAFVEHIDGQRNMLCLTNGENIPISRPRKKECMAALCEYWGENL